MTAPSPTDQGYPPAAAAAAQRCEFELTYTRARTPRLIWPGFLGGDPIPNAHGHDLDDSTGEWEAGDNTLPTNDDPEAWIGHYASMAVQEAVHEALEWFRVDDQPWLDPHGPHADDIRDYVAALCSLLTELRAEGTR